jgi:hypothetical protein
MTVSSGPPGNTRLVTYSWRYGTRGRQLEETAGGQPLEDAWGQAGHGSTMVDYRQRSWVRTGPGTAGPYQPSPCQAHGALIFAPGATAADLKPLIEAGLRCGQFRVAGHQRVDGIDAIKLAGSSGRGGIAFGDGDLTLWVDPRIYLPVQMAGDQSPPGLRRRY